MTSPSDRLVHMANQISAFFASQHGGDAVEDVADHLEKFWDPRMRAAIISHCEEGGAGLDPLVADAVRRLAGRARP